MARRTARLGLAVALALSLWGCHPAATSAADPVDAVRMVRLPDGRQLAMRCSGQGSPTVLLESGFGGWSVGWAKTQPRIAETTRVCSYDRAGYGLSDEGPAPRDGAAVARDLDMALKAAGMRGPFVLVGHSAGGLYVRLFAARRRSDVVGMVLVDPSVEHQDKRFQAVFGPGAGSLAGQRNRAARCLRATEDKDASPDIPELASCFPRGKRQIVPATLWRTEISELDTLWGDTSDQVDRIGDLLEDVPVIVLTAREGDGGQAQRVWSQLHAEIAARSRDGVVRDVQSSHLMMNDRPDVVAGAVDELVRRNRDSTRRR